MPLSRMEGWGDGRGGGARPESDEGGGRDPLQRLELLPHLFPWEEGGGGGDGGCSTRI